MEKFNIQTKKKQKGIFLDSLNGNKSLIKSDTTTGNSLVCRSLSLDTPYPGNYINNNGYTTFDTFFIMLKVIETVKIHGDHLKYIHSRPMAPIPSFLNGNLF